MVLNRAFSSSVYGWLSNVKTKKMASFLYFVASKVVHARAIVVSIRGILLPKALTSFRLVMTNCGMVTGM